MAKLVDIYNFEKEPVIKRRQLPLNIYENLTVSYPLHFDITTSVDYSEIEFIEIQSLKQASEPLLNCIMRKLLVGSMISLNKIRLFVLA